MNTITIDEATNIHNAAVEANYPADALRINYYRIGGGGMACLLSVPGDDNAPCYQRINGHFQHVSGMTLEEWMNSQQQDAIEEIGGMAAYHEARTQDAPWLADAEAMQADYRDAAETTAGLLAF